jgi:hypothetical protein
MSKFDRLVSLILEDIQGNNIPQLVIDSMMEGRPDHISKEDYFKTTIGRLKGIKWSNPSKVDIPLKSLAVIHHIYHPWFESTEEIQRFVKAYTAAVLTNKPLPQEFSSFQGDIDKKYDTHVDDVINKRPLIVLRKNNQYSIIDGSHRFWGKVSHELKINPKLQAVSVMCYIGDI